MFRILIRPKFYIESLDNYSGIYLSLTKIDDTNVSLKLINNSDKAILDELVLSDSIAYNTQYFIVKEYGNKFSQLFNNDEIEAGRVHSNCVYPQVDVVVGETGIGMQHSIQLYKSQTDEVCILYLGIPTFFENFQPEEFNYSGKLWEYLCERYPEYKTKKEITNKKRELLIGLDPNNSLAYIEAQLDFVTKMLFAVLEKEPYLKAHALEAVKEYSNVKSAFDANSVFTIKDEHLCYLEIEEGKKEIREKQDKFLKDKAAILGGE